MNKEKIKILMVFLQQGLVNKNNCSAANAAAGHLKYLTRVRRARGRLVFSCCRIVAKKNLSHVIAIKNVEEYL